MKSNPEAYEEHKVKDRLWCKLYRASMTLDQRKRYNEKTKIRMRKMRAKNAKEPKGIKTRKNVQKEREYWRLKKREQRAKMTGQAKRRELEKRREKYHEKKGLKCKVKLDLGDKSNCEKVKKVRKEVTKPEVFAEEIQNIMDNATPRKKAVLKDKGIVFSPRSKEKYQLNKTVAKSLRSFLDKYKSARKNDARILRRTVTKNLIGKSCDDQKLRKALNIKWDYWARMSVVGDEEVKRSEAFSDEKIKHIWQFYKDESHVLPDKRYASTKSGLSKRLMSQTLRQEHARYVKKKTQRAKCL